METESGLGLASSMHGDPRGAFANRALGSVLTYNAGNANGGRPRRGRLVSYRRVPTTDQKTQRGLGIERDSVSPYRPTKTVAIKELEYREEALKSEGRPPFIESVRLWALYFRIDGDELSSAIADAENVAAILFNLPPDARLVAETMRKKHWAMAVLDRSQLVELTMLDDARVDKALDQLRGHDLLKTFYSGIDHWASVASPQPCGYSIKAPEGVYRQSRGNE